MHIVLAMRLKILVKLSMKAEWEIVGCLHKNEVFMVVHYSYLMLCNTTWRQRMSYNVWFYVERLKLAFVE